VTCTTPARLEQLHGRFTLYNSGSNTNGFIDPQTRRLFVWPASVSSTMKSLVTIRLVDAGTTGADGGANAFVEALRVSGEIPTGAVTATTFDPGTGRSYAILYCRDPFRYEVASFAFTDGGVHFTRHASNDAPDANGYTIQDIAVTGNQLGASRGNAVIPITLTATTASWAAESPGTPFTQTSIYDPAGHRTLGIGGYRVVSGSTFEWYPEVKTRDALAPNWSELVMSGTGPASVPSPMMAPRPFVAFDRQNNRMLVTSTRPGMINNMPIQLQTVFEANLQTNAWNLIGDLDRSITSSRAFALDPQYPQVFDTSGFPLGVMSLAKGAELKSLPFTTSGALPPMATLTAAVRLPDGTVLVSASGALYLFDEPARAWTQVRGAPMPMEVQNGHSLTLDAANNRVLVFGGQRGAVASNKVYALALGTFVAAELPTTGTAPPARSSHAALAIDGQLIIAGGTTDGTTGLGDVFALDLTTQVWRKLADVAPRSKPALISREHEVWVIGGWKHGTQLGEPSIAAIDVATGTTRTIAVQGAWPTRQGLFWSWAAAGDSMIAIDSGDSNDFSKNQLWELTVSGSTAQWRNSDPDAMDDSLSGAIGVGGSGCEGALFVGPSSFRVTR